MCVPKGGHRTCVTTFKSKFVEHSTEIIWQSKIKTPLLTLKGGATGIGRNTRYAGFSQSAI